MAWWEGEDRSLEGEKYTFEESRGKEEKSKEKSRRGEKEKEKREINVSYRWSRIVSVLLIVPYSAWKSLKIASNMIDLDHWALILHKHFYYKQWFLFPPWKSMKYSSYFHWSLGITQLKKIMLIFKNIITMKMQSYPGIQWFNTDPFLHCPLPSTKASHPPFTTDLKIFLITWQGIKNWNTLP